MKPAIIVRTIADGVLARAIFEGPTLVTSDHHLNVHDGRDNFQAELFVSWLMGYDPNRWGLVFLGDFVDLWEAGSLPPILRDNCGVLRLISFFRKTLLKKGNHDEDLEAGDLPAALGIEMVEEFPEDGFVGWHGHELDPACSGPGAKFGKAATVFWAALEVLGLGARLEGWKDEILRRRKVNTRTASKRGDDNEAYIRDAIARAEAAMRAGKEPPIVVASGHTHKAQLYRLPGLPGHYYANPGSWTRRGLGSALEIDGERMRLLEITAA